MIDHDKIVFGVTTVKWSNKQNLPEYENDVRAGLTGIVVSQNEHNPKVYKVKYEVPRTHEPLYFNCSIDNLDVVSYGEKSEQMPSITISHKNVAILKFIMTKCPGEKGFKIETCGF